MRPGLGTHGPRTGRTRRARGARPHRSTPSERQGAPQGAFRARGRPDYLGPAPGGLGVVPDTLRAALAARSGLNLTKADPLKYRRLTCLAQRRAIEFIARGIVTYWHAGNA